MPVRKGNGTTMTRLKKELRKRGVKLNSDYDHLPFYIKGNSCFDPGNICVEDVFVNAEIAQVTVFYNVIDQIIRMNRDGSLEVIL